MSDTAGLGHNNPPEPTLEERFDQIIKDVETIAAKGTALPSKIESDEKLGDLVEVVKAAKRLEKTIDENRKAENKPLDDTIKVNNAWFYAHRDRLLNMVRHLEARAGTYNAEKREAERLRLAEEAAERRRAHEAEVARQEEARKAAEAEGKEKADGIAAEMEAERLERLRNEQAAAEAAIFKTSGPTRTSAGTVGTTKKIGFRIKARAEMDLNELKDSFTIDMIEKAIRDHIRRNKKSVPLKGVELFDDHSTNIR